MKINGIVARNESLDWGVLRYGVVGISGTDYIPPIPTEDMAKQRIQEIIDPLQSPEDSINLFLYLCRSQLFWDGNKRTAFIATNVLLIKNGLGIFQIKEKYQFKEESYSFKTIGQISAFLGFSTALIMRYYEMTFSIWIRVILMVLMMGMLSISMFINIRTILSSEDKNKKKELV